MPMPARDLWSRIQKELQGRSEDEQLRVLRRHLADLHDEWKGPYKELRDRLRRQVARLEGHDAVRSQAGRHDPFHIKSQGDARVVFAGMPNAGKSAVVGALTGAATAVAEYPFATTHPLPGMLPCEGGVLQLIDAPPVVADLANGQGSGRPLLSLFAGADAIAVVVDLSADAVAQVETVFAELADACVHPVPGPLATSLHVRGKGGVRFGGHPLVREDEATARSLLADAHIEHAEVVVRSGFDEAVLQSLIVGDLPLPTVLIGTHASSEFDGATASLGEAWPEYRRVWVDVAAADTFKPVTATLLESLGFMVVDVLQRSAEDAEHTSTLVHLASNITQVGERAGVASKDLKGARVWGASALRPGQVVSVDHLVERGDRIYLQS